MTTSEQRNEAIIRSRRRKLEVLADSYAAALHETVSILHRRGRPGQILRRRPSIEGEQRRAGMTA